MSEQLPEVDPYPLLIEWLKWWRNDEEAPAKMPDGLHVRTAMALLVRAQAVGGDHALAAMAEQVIGPKPGTEGQSAPPS